MSKYAIWNKKDSIITPSGEVFTAEQWMDRYPVAKMESVTIVCSAGELNGGFFGTLGQLVQIYEEDGCDFSDCATNQEKLDAINNFIEEQKLAEQEATKAAANAVTPEERIAAALEYQNLSNM